MLFLFKRYKRGKILGDKCNIRKPQFVGIKNIKLLGLVYYIDSPLDVALLEEVVSTLNAESFEWRMILMERKRNMLKKNGLLAYRDDPHFIVLEKRDLNWYGMARSEEFNALMQMDVTPFIIPNKFNAFLMDYIACKANTSLTIGMNENADLYRMIIRPSNGGVLNQLEFLHQALYNLKSINQQ